MREMYAAGLKEVTDLVGVHGAGFKAEPEADPDIVAQRSDLTNNDPTSPELRRIYAFRHVEDIRQILIENGDATKQLAILEMGWTSDPRPGSPYAWHSVSEDTKGEYIVRALKLAAERWRPWMGYMTVIYLPETRWTRNDEQYWWSFTDTDGAPRAVLPGDSACLSEIGAPLRAVSLRLMFDNNEAPRSCAERGASFRF